MKEILRQAKRARERKQKEQKARIIKQLQLSDLEFINNDKNITLSAMGPHLVDFVNVLGLTGLLEEYVDIDKRKSPYNSEKLSELMVVLNILGYDRIESSHSLDQDSVLKEKLGIKRYPDPETFQLNAHIKKEADRLGISIIWWPSADGGKNGAKLEYVKRHFVKGAHPEGDLI